MPATAMDAAESQAIEKEIVLAVSFSFVTLTASSNFFNVSLLIPPPLFSLTLPLPPLSSSLATNEGDNRYHNKNLLVKLSTIPPKSVILTQRKIFVKTAILGYFSGLKKHSKV